MATSRSGSTLFGEMFLQGIEAALKNVFAHAFGEFVGILGRGVEACRPFRIGAVAVRYAAQLQRGLMVGQRLRGLEDRVAAQEIRVGKSGELFAQRRAAGEL